MRIREMYMRHVAAACKLLFWQRADVEDFLRTWIGFWAGRPGARDGLGGERVCEFGLCVEHGDEGVGL